MGVCVCRVTLLRFFFQNRFSLYGGCGRGIKQLLELEEPSENLLWCTYTTKAALYLGRSPHFPYGVFESLAVSHGQKYFRCDLSGAA